MSMANINIQYWQALIEAIRAARPFSFYQPFII